METKHIFAKLYWHGTDQAFVVMHGNALLMQYHYK